MKNKDTEKQEIKDDGNTEKKVRDDTPNNKECGNIKVSEKNPLKKMKKRVK